MRYETVLFDLDGTLIDSAEMILASLRHTTRHVLGREIPDPELRAGMGLTLAAHMNQIDGERAEELVRVYSEHNEALHDELVPCAGVFDVLAALVEEGRAVGIVTSKRRDTVSLAFERIPELRSYFDVVVAAEDVGRHKPNPDGVVAALERLGASAATAAYVGDSPVDVQAAKAAGVAAIAVTWGKVHDRARLEREEPDAIVDSPEELLGVL